uniref:Cysteine desulfurase n=1 Tax=Denticeps clupeoides TaxID=299321 RepID=A0AAY4DYY3_9TELE
MGGKIAPSWGADKCFVPALEKKREDKRQEFRSSLDSTENFRSLQTDPPSTHKPMAKVPVVRVLFTPRPQQGRTANDRPASAQAVVRLRRASVLTTRLLPIKNTTYLHVVHRVVTESIKSRELEKDELRPLYMDFQATTPMVCIFLPKYFTKIHKCCWGSYFMGLTQNILPKDQLSFTRNCSLLNKQLRSSIFFLRQDPRVLDAMLPYQVNYYGNPHSRTHAYGWESESAMEKARKQVADLISADPREIVFTSGATESNNMSIKGVARFYKPKKKHIITTQTEHKCVLDSCRVLESEGFEVTYLPVKNNGLIDIKQLEQTIRSDTSLVSIMTVNNEIGVKQPIQEIGHICQSKNVFFHTDAAQAVGKIPINVSDWKIDLMSISGHKIYGPKGVGALYVRRRPRVRIEPLQSGGGQERGLRSGTVPTPLAVGLGAACEIAQQEMEYDHKRVSMLASRLVQKIMSEIPEVVMNGDSEQRYPGCINLSFAYVEGESLLMALKDVALSSGSACTSASLEPSYVLRAIGADEDLAHSSIRFGIGRFTTEEEVDYTAEKCIQQVRRLREMSPLWEMVQEGIDLKSIKWTQH